ncbi:unnamed protein product [Rotaria sordida]|uniref:Uncharacterized protein n=1 Tax=Rotaria sordida TaxID=392033 RepID=A0A815XTK8_9BILA|nr:unnamed protein product [Rotaria sordida]CAF1561866.1 unnamed protein product [Rotaria sordida]
MITNEKTDSNEHSLPKIRRKTDFTILCLTFILVYTSYNAVTNLQSSIHTDNTIGYHSLAIISGCSILSCLIFTNPLIFIGGYKWTIVLAQFGFLIYIAANMYPKVWLMHPASVFCGLFRAGFWTALSAYITDLGTSKQAGPITDAVINKYFGIFFSAFQTSQIWGNLVAYILYGIFMGLIFISIVLVIIMLDQKRKWKSIVLLKLILVLAYDAHMFVDATPKHLLIDSRHFIVSTFKQMKSIKQLLLLPLAFWIGTSEAFLFGIFTSSFITCTVGLPYVGLIMITYGVTASVCSVIVGWLGRYRIRVPCYILGALLCYASYIVMFLWKPVPSQVYILFILVGMKGIASAIWDPIEAALYGSLFEKKEEAAYSNMWLGQNVDYLVVYLYGSVVGYGGILWRRNSTM